MIGKHVTLLDGSSVVIVDRFEAEESHATIVYEHYSAHRYAEQPFVITTKTLKYLVRDDNGRAWVVSVDDISWIVDDIT